MDKPYFRYLLYPKLDNPILVEGLPGFGNVGKIAARLLIDFRDAELFAEMYSPSLPNFVIVGKDGICRPPHYEFYASSTKKPQFIISIGDAQPSPNNMMAHYELCNRILDFVEEYNCGSIVTMDGVLTQRPTGEVYMAATSSELAGKIKEKGATIYGEGKIVGATGLLLGLAKKRGIDGICLLGATTGVEVDRETAFLVFNFLMKVLEIQINT